MRRHRNIQFAALRCTAPGLIAEPGAGIQIMAILMKVDKHKIGVVLECVKHPVAVMSVYIHISQATDAVLAAQRLDCDTAIIEHAETGGTIPARMVQTGDRHKRAPAITSHNAIQSLERGANHHRRRLVDPFESRRVTRIEITGTGLRLLLYPLQIRGSMETQDLKIAGLDRRMHLDPLVQTGFCHALPEGSHAIRSEWMSFAEAIARQRGADINTDRKLLHDVRLRYRAQYKPSKQTPVQPVVPDWRHAPSQHALSRYNGSSFFTGDSYSMAQYVYTMNQVGKVVPPKREILRNISLSFFPGAKIGVLGLNGSGKSTLLRIMAGIDTDINGEARPQAGINIGYLSQEPQLDESKDVRGNVEEALAEITAAQSRLDEVYAAYAEPDADFDALAAEQAKLENILQATGGHNLERTLEVAADALRLPPWEADVSKLSGGEKRRVALCKLLLSKPDMLLLDEPTNHLDAESVAWLEHFLHDYAGTVVAVTHDRYFLDNVAGWILELDRGHGIPWEGNYSSWLEQKETRLQQEEKTESARQKAMKAELEWVRSNPKGRHAKSKARLARFEDLSSQENQKRNETKALYIPPGPRLGELVIEANHISKAFGDRLLINDLNFQLPQGGIVGIIGPNGAGKTTLFRMLTGAEPIDGGELRIGDTVQMAYVDQSRDALDGSKSVWEEISDGQDIITVGKYEVNSRAYAARFNFAGSEQQKRVGDLSGGERNRVHLAKLLRSGGNLLLLDEPTNDLDVETLRALEEALLDFPGCAVVISHDRWFLDRIATHMLAFEGDSEVVWFEGNYADYEADRKRRLGSEAEQPHRIKYKRLG